MITRHKSYIADSDLESKFLFYWRIIARDVTEPLQQYQFDDKRRWRIDFAWPDVLLGVEIDGAGGGGYGRQVRCHNCGTVVRARLANGAPGKPLLVPYASHASGAGLGRDAEKSNALAIAGWRLLRYTAKHMDENPSEVIGQVRDLLVELSK